MIVIQQMLENQISLLKQCLQFYANDRNWEPVIKGEKSLIQTDKGFLAQETLRNIGNLENQNQQFSDQYNAIVQSQTSPETLMEEIKKLTDQSK